ncbi:MAG: hypothetical protein ACT4N4_03650 [Rhodospirillales bacterium]
MRPARWGGGVLLALAIWGAAAPAQAQTPFPTIAYIVGRANGVDLAANSEIQMRDGRPDGWLRVLVRAIGFHIAVANGRVAPGGGVVNEGVGAFFEGIAGGQGFSPGVSGYYAKSMTLRHKTIYGLAWDTIPGNGVPLLVVADGGTIVNAPTGSIAGLSLAQDRQLDLYVADPGHIGWREAGFVLEIDTLDGKLALEVQPYNIYEANYLY